MRADCRYLLLLLVSALFVVASSAAPTTHIVLTPAPPLPQTPPLPFPGGRSSPASRFLGPAQESLIVDGVLLADGRSDHTRTTVVGTYTSQLQAYIAAAYKPVVEVDWNSHSWINATELRTLHVRPNIMECPPPLLSG